MVSMSQEEKALAMDARYEKMKMDDRKKRGRPRSIKNYVRKRIRLRRKCAH